MNMHRSPLWVAFFETQRRFVYLLFKILFGVRIRGKKYIPGSGAAILAPNHQTVFDGLVIGFRVPSPIYCAVEGSFFHKPFIGWWLGTFGGLPLRGPRDRRGYESCLQVVREGARLIIFPEGHRSRDGSLMKLRQGAARAALTCGVDIVPVTVVGAHEAWPRGRMLPRLCVPVIVKFYPPIRCEVAEKADLRRRVKEVNVQLERIMQRRLEAWRRVRERRRPAQD
ncbi:MAG: 1-acyl-sn-glycerol-3-phosphate acyltransferase [bacterium]|nr:1-acyl-sn-glycerol-3-phosphate acyltransferase [bacterium]